MKKKSTHSLKEIKNLLDVLWARGIIDNDIREDIITVRYSQEPLITGQSRMMRREQIGEKR